MMKILHRMIGDRCFEIKSDNGFHVICPYCGEERTTWETYGSYIGLKTHIIGKHYEQTGLGQTTVRGNGNE